MDIVTQTNLTEYPLLSRGKVRDIYAIDDERLLIVTTDRISAFDVVLPDPIPYKGVVLNRITIFWMEKFRDRVKNHLLATEVADFPAPLQKHASVLEGRAVIARRAKPLPIECIARGYLSGSGLKDYAKTGSVCGHALPPGLRDSDRLPAPIFTPSTKAEIGQHDENITLEQAAATLPAGLLPKVEALTLELYSAGAAFALEKGIIIADTKFEFGLLGEELILIDEVLTPDSSRFWPLDAYAPGGGQPSFDKQFVRDWLESIGFDKRPPGPRIPEDIAKKTSEKYLEAYARLTGAALIL